MGQDTACDSEHSFCRNNKYHNSAYYTRAKWYGNRDNRPCFGYSRSKSFRFLYLYQVYDCYRVSAKGSVCLKNDHISYEVGGVIAISTPPVPVKILNNHASLPPSV